MEMREHSEFGYNNDFNPEFHSDLPLARIHQSRIEALKVVLDGNFEPQSLSDLTLLCDAEVAAGASAFFDLPEEWGAKGFAENLLLMPQYDVLDGDTHEYANRSQLIGTAHRRIDELEDYFCIVDDSMKSFSAKMEFVNRLRRQQSEFTRGILRSGPAPSQFLGMTPEMIHGIIKRTFAVELNENCSIACDFCGVGAVGGKPKNFMHTTTARWLALAVGAVSQNTPFYYYKTDPLDYPDYAHIAHLGEAARGRPIFTSTEFPRTGAAEEIHTLGERLSRLSLNKTGPARMRNAGLMDKDCRLLSPTLVDSLQFMSYGNARTLLSAAYKSKKPHQYLAGSADFITDNSKLLLNFCATPENIFAIGGARRKWKKPEPPPQYERTIACRDGVIISPRGFRNSVRCYGSDQYVDGSIDGEFTADSLRDGYSECRGFAQRVRAGKQVRLEELLPYGVIQKHAAQENPMCSNIRYQDALKKCLDDGVPLDRDGLSIDYDTRRELTIITYDKKQKPRPFTLRYSQLDGAVDYLSAA